MIKQLIDRVVFLEKEGDEAVFAERENAFQRMPFMLERILLRYVLEGKPRELAEFCLTGMVKMPDLRLAMGKTSKDRLRQLKYNTVSGIALACRTAILGGAPEIECYARSYSAIMKIDESSSEVAIFKILFQTTLDYAALVQKTKSSAKYPPVVRHCIQYIASHTHQNITLDELAEGSGYSKEYIAKLFRKHVGVPISEHIQMVRIQEAKSLLRQGKSSGEVAYILNYTSQSYFARQFKKQTGMTPMVYRNMLKLDPSMGDEKFCFS